jgi:glucose-6-phosphate 1-dehydrogenase
LNHRKLTPALFNLFADGFLDANFKIFGIGRTDYNDQDFRSHLLEGIKSFPEDLTKKWTLGQFQEHLFYLQMDAGTGAKKDFFCN